MTNKQLHIGIDLALKVFNPTLLSRLLPQEKDYIFNKVIMDLIHTTAEDVRHSIMNSESYIEISNYYNILEPYLIINTLEYIGQFGNYNDYILPKYDEVATGTSMLIAGVQYKVEEVGNLNEQLAVFITEQYAYTGEVIVENDLFTIPHTSIKYRTYATSTAHYVFDVYAGIKYKIIKACSVDFTVFGAANNNAGTIFICDHTDSYEYTFTDENSLISEMDAELEILGITFVNTATPPNFKLIAIKNLNIFEHISLNALVEIRNINRLAASNLIKGKSYKVIHFGRFIDLTTFGSKYENVEEGYIFVATKSGTPIWDSSIIGDITVYSEGSFIELDSIICRLVKPNDIDAFLDHPYLGVDVNPIYTLNSNKISVYHNNRYNIHGVSLTYVRQPIIMDSDMNVETDMNVSVHPQLVTLAVKEIVATNQPQLYSTVNAQSQSSKS
jgi:hypothetical protein